MHYVSVKKHFSTITENYYEIIIAILFLQMSEHYFTATTVDKAFREVIFFLHFITIIEISTNSRSKGRAIVKNLQFNAISMLFIC